ncbi:hypothetical protein GCM10028805_64520 [Spirosoma harenae]
MNQQNVANKTTPFQLKRILSTTLALLAYLTGLIFVPGFLVASLVDAFIPLKAGPLWGYTLLVSILLLSLSCWHSQPDLRWGLIRYAIGSAATFLGLVIISLFASGHIFYGYSLQKMVEVSESDFVQIEQKRGRLPSFTAVDSTITRNKGLEVEDDQVSRYLVLDACNVLNNSRFTGMNGLYYLRLFNQQGNTFEFTGKVEARDVNGKLRKNGNKLTIFNGNVTGEFTLLNNCQEITGHFQDEFGGDISFDYARR